MRKISAYGYLIAFSIPIGIVFTLFLGGFYNYLVPIIVFLLLPILDYFIGTEDANFDTQEEKKIKNNHYYKYVTYLWVFIQTATLLFVIYFCSINTLSLFEWVGLTISMMIMNGGIGITVAHELGHRPNDLERILSKFLLVQVFYGHFYIEHNRGHHTHVATLADPATSRKGQTFYRFWIQTVFESIKSAWNFEGQRLAFRKLNTWSFKNEVLRLWLYSFLFFSTLVLFASWSAQIFNWQIFIFLFAQSFLSFSLLEAVNYIEHYGILRKELAPGKFERVNPTHSWNSNHILSNYFLFQLQRHSDHHVAVSKRYQLLNQYENSPQLPNGYPAMVLLALFPPLWFKVMNKKLVQWENKETKNE